MLALVADRTKRWPSIRTARGRALVAAVAAAMAMAQRAVGPDMEPEGPPLLLASFLVKSFRFGGGII